MSFGLGASAHCDDVDERRLPGVLEANERQLHLLLEKEAAARFSRCVGGGSHGGGHTRMIGAYPRR